MSKILSKFYLQTLWVSLLLGYENKLSLTEKAIVIFQVYTKNGIKGSVIMTMKNAKYCEFYP